MVDPIFSLSRDTGRTLIRVTPKLATNCGVTHAPFGTSIKNVSQFSRQWLSWRWASWFLNCISKQVKYRPKPYYMRKQPDITTEMRAILVDWLVEVGEEYKLRTETLYLAVNYLDRFLSCMSVLRGKLQLVGTAAILLAAWVFISWNLSPKISFAHCLLL